MINPQIEMIRAHGLCERAGDDELIERKHGALFRIDPEQLLVLGAFGHGKQAEGISSQQYLRRDFEIDVGRDMRGKSTRSPSFGDRRRAKGELFGSALKNDWRDG